MKAKKVTKEKEGKVSVVIQREDRLSAIRDLARAIKELSLALNTSVEVSISDSNFTSCTTGIQVEQGDVCGKTRIEGNIIK